MRHRASCSTTCRYVIGTIIIAMMSSLSAIADTYYGPKDYSIVPPLPDVATLMQYQEIPVDCFSGVPNISYDLFTIKAGSISIPIRLSGLGLSASFAYDDNKRIVMSSSTPIKIDAQQASTSYPSKFVVKDASGIKYTFGTNEKTRYEYYYRPPELTRTLDSVLYTSAWHLSKVSDPCGNEVRFVYSDKTPTKWRESGSDTRNYSLNREFDHSIVSDAHSCGTTVYYSKRLERIEWSAGKVVYEYAGIDASLGASGHKNYKVPGSKSKIREGSTFLSPIKFVLILKTL